MKKTRFLISILLVVFLASCDVLKQASMVANLFKCEFRLESVKNFQLAGVNIQNKKSLADLSILDAAKITNAYLSKSFPAAFTLNIQVKNPNSGVAGISNIVWILFIDNAQITQGNVNKRVQVAPNGGISTIPLEISFDMIKVFSGKTKDAILNLAFNLAGQGTQPSNIMVKAKPSVYIGNQRVDYPGYLNIKKEFSSMTY